MVLTFWYTSGAPVNIEQDLRPVFVFGQRSSLVGFDAVHVDSDQFGPDSPANVRVEQAAHGDGVSAESLYVHQGAPQSLVYLQLLLSLPVEPCTRRERAERWACGESAHTVGGAYCGGRGAPLG